MSFASTTVTSSFLRQFVCFKDLPESELALIARGVKLMAGDKDTVLFTAGSDDGLDYFLVKGEVHLIAKDGRTNSVNAEDSVARNPLARLRPRLYTAKAATSMVYFTVAAQPLAKNFERSPLQNQNIDSIVVTELTLESYEVASRHWGR
jgi:CRP-like cAMP-binding protein